MTAIPPHISLDSGENPQYSMIWLHGLGADGYDFVPVVEELQLPVAMRYLFPHAPEQAITINGGYIMRAWYDITSNNIDQQQDAPGIYASSRLLNQLIEQEKSRGIPASHIYLAGFSQGGAIALHTALRQPEPLGGVLALSTYLPLTETIASEKTTAARATPIFMAHGRHDDIVPYALGIMSKKRLETEEVKTTWREYNMAHPLCAEELVDIQNWLSDALKHAPTTPQ